MKPASYRWVAGFVLFKVYLTGLSFFLRQRRKKINLLIINYFAEFGKIGGAGAAVVVAPNYPFGLSTILMLFIPC